MNSIFLVFKKEMTDIFRDRKTLVISILIPILLFPIIFGFMDKNVSNMKNEIKSDLKIIVNDEGNSSLNKFIKEQKNLTIVKRENWEKAVKDGDVFIAIDIPKDFESNLSKEMGNKVRVIYDNSSQKSEMAKNVITTVFEDYSKTIVRERLRKRGISAEILEPVKIEEKTVEKNEDGASKMILSLIFPMFILIYSVTGPMASAVDLGSGEKERGTLEPLLTTPVNRLSLLWGKLMAITVMGFFASIASISGVIISMFMAPNLFGAQNGAGVTIQPLTLFCIGLISILTTMMFGAIELSISIYARSFKEAQSYLAPLNMIAIIPVYATYIMDAKNISLIYFSIPIANISCLMKELISGIYNVSHIIIVFAWIIIYIVVSILFARYMFSKEEVIFRS